MAMNDMLADILKKAIPPEVMAMLSEEKIKELGAQAKSAVDNLNIRLTAIEQTNARILEYLENDYRSDSSGKLADSRNASDTTGSPSDGSS